MTRWLAILGVIIATASARAQSHDVGFIGKDISQLEIDDCPPHAPMSDDQLRRVAGEHYQRGEVLYVQGDYPGAVQELVSSYCLTPYYTILKDIGQAYERELEYAKALGYYERYVMAVPRDAQRTAPCAPDPQDDKKIVLARITVLSGLKAKIRVEATPADAEITLYKDGRVAVAGHSGQELEVVGGPYQMTITRDGYQPVTREIHAEIGKPYTYSEQLEALKGRLIVRVIPGDARLFLDDRQVGTGSLDTALPGGRYKLVAEAPDRLPSTRVVEVFANRDTTLTFELPIEPQTGRRQLLAYAAIAGGAAGGLLAGAQEDTRYDTAAVGAGVLAGLAAAYYGTPHDLALGTSSLTITSSLIGGVAGSGLAGIITRDGNTATPFIGAGLVLGGITGYYVADRIRVRTGEAAVINSGALWGTISGGLFAISFNPSQEVASGLVLSGLGMGTIGGTLLSHYFSVSRGRAALIDASGVVGIVGGLAIENLVTRAAGTTSQSDERTANYALGGLAVGLILGGVLTRHMDEPNVGLAPALGKASTAAGGSTTTFGLGGAF